MSSTDVGGSRGSLESGSLSVLFGQEIRRRRRNMGMTQEDVADRARLDRTTIGRVERGDFRATLEVANAMAGACGAPLWEVLRDLERP